jgi:hypothetical protein
LLTQETVGLLRLKPLGFQPIKKRLVLVEEIGRYRKVVSVAIGQCFVVSVVLVYEVSHLDCHFGKIQVDEQLHVLGESLLVLGVNQVHVFHLLEEFFEGTALIFVIKSYWGQPFLRVLLDSVCVIVPYFDVTFKELQKRHVFSS